MYICIYVDLCCCDVVITAADRSAPKGQLGIIHYQAMENSWIFYVFKSICSKVIKVYERSVLLLLFPV